MRKTKIVTSIYSNLFGTKFGGRIGRKDHYRWSLLSLLKMTDAFFVCYTSKKEYDSLVEFFYVQNNISEELLKFKIFDLEDNDTSELINKWKNFEKTKQSDRCIEIQYMKFFWTIKELEDYENVFWFDAGLSHSGIIPDKYLDIKNSNTNRHYYESGIFNNYFLEQLINFSETKFVLVSKENSRNYWSATVNPMHFTNYNNSRHIIGGFFGGKRDLWNKIVYLFTKYLYKVTEHDKRLYHEEDILTLLYNNHKELFKTLEFDVWWHENNITKDCPSDFLIKNKSFYKVFEGLIL
jgi:hypothetical protein